MTDQTNQSIRSTFGKMGKNRRIKGGGSKNSNKCFVFPAAYKLVHLHTNLIFKHSIQNLQNTTKSPFSHHPIQKSQYRTQYRQTQLKSTLPPILNHNQKPQFKPLSSYINTRILRKIPHFYRLPTFHQKSHQSNQNLQHQHLYSFQHKIQHKDGLYKYSPYSKT